MKAPWAPATTAGPITVIDECWTDGRRARDVAARIYLPATAAFRLVLFSPWLGGSCEDYAYLGGYWAGHGYASVHLEHPDSGRRAWDDGRLDLARIRQAATDTQIRVDRVLDVRFAVDRITGRARAGQGWERRLAAGPMGVAGHSYGAHTALCVAGQAVRGTDGGLVTLGDARVGAAVAMSPSAPREREGPAAVFRAVATPCLHLTGTHDRSPAGFTPPEARRVPFDHIDLADQYLVVFAGAGHDAFVADSGTGSPVWAATQQVTLAFWDAYLRASEQARAWLCDGGCAAALQSSARFEHKPARRPGGDPISRPEERP